MFPLTPRHTPDVPPRDVHVLREHILPLVRHLSNHHQYLPILETFILETTKTFYETESVERYDSLRADAREFLKHCEVRRTEEKERAKAVLPEASWDAIVQTTDRALLTGRLDWLAQDGASKFCLWMMGCVSLIVARSFAQAYE